VSGTVNTVLEGILDTIERRGAAYFVLLDPEGPSIEENLEIARACENAGVDALLVGGSLQLRDACGRLAAAVKAASALPVIVFPGDAGFVTAEADAILFLSLVSGRNPRLLIGEHVRAAPLLRDAAVEPIPTAYMLVESGATTSVEYMSGTRPLPRTKPRIAMAHALAAQYLGMRIAFFDAGSGARQAVPAELVRAVASYIDLPVMVGGGIREPEGARELVAAGARIIVTGDVIEKTGDVTLLHRFAEAIHSR